MLACGFYLGAPWGWMNDPGFRTGVGNRTVDHSIGLQVAFESARELDLRVITHAGV